MKFDILVITRKFLSVYDYTVVFCMEESNNAQWLRKLGRIEKHWWPEKYQMTVALGGSMNFQKSGDAYNTPIQY